MDKTLAALSFFTRLPFWRLRQIPADAYKRVVDVWPVAGWVTGGVMASAYLLASLCFAPPIAALVAVAARLLLTGALHEDGLADFFDGMGGGGSDRSRILAIMKDSHIGSYGVIALIVYFALLVASIATLPPLLGAAAIFAADTWSKACAAFIINLLPYARTAETAKNRLVYSRMTPPAAVVCVIAGAAPLLLLPAAAWPASIAPVAVSGAMIAYLRHRLGGYTGDCCGATFLLSELAMLLTLSALLH